MVQIKLARRRLTERLLRVCAVKGGATDERDVENGAMVEPLRHRQTKGAETDMFYLTPPRHSRLVSRAPSVRRCATVREMKEGPLMEENISVGWIR
jgi:hypothetical protein